MCSQALPVLSLAVGTSETRSGSNCSRCGNVTGKVYPFPLATSARHPQLCGKCQDAWDEFLISAVRRWHDGLRRCFFCSRPLGDHLFQVESAIGPCCVECRLKLAELESSVH